MQYYKVPDSSLESGFSLHALEVGVEPATVTDFPKNAIAITEEEAEALRPKPNPAAIIEAKKQAVRAVRKLILDILTGIATEANITGDADTIAAYLVVLQGLKDITEDWPTDPALVDGLVVQRYAALVSQCTPQMVSAFAQVAS